MISVQVFIFDASSLNVYPWSSVSCLDVIDTRCSRVILCRIFPRWIYAFECPSNHFMIIDGNQYSGYALFI